MTRSGPLTGVRVIDLTTMLAGPFASMIMADLGADVIKVEPPGGDFIRKQGPFAPEDTLRAYGGYFQSVNRNKRSIVLDLTDATDRATFLRLAGTAQVVLENYRSGVMDRFDLSYERLRGLNPRLVYAAIRGFGDARTGESPMCDWPAYDVTAQALAGLMEITGEPAGPPTKVGAGVGDMVPALFAVIGVLAALRRADQSGVGEFVDVAMYDAVLALCERTIYQYSYRGEVPKRQGNGHPLLCPFGLYPASDGWVSIAAPSDGHWRSLCELIDRPELALDARTRDNAGRLEHRELVSAALREWTQVRSKQQIVGRLGGRVPVAPVNNAESIFHDPHPRSRNMLVEVEHPGVEEPVTIVGQPIKFASTPLGETRRAPLLGEHAAEILAELNIRE